MKKGKIIFLAVIGVLCLSFFFCGAIILKNKNFYSNSEVEKTACSIDDDCIVSVNQPEGRAVCVNKNWQEEWDKNPESRKYSYDLAFGFDCAGSEFAGDEIKMLEEICACVYSSCQPINLTNYPGCVLIGFDSV